MLISRDVELSAHQRKGVLSKELGAYYAVVLSLFWFPY
jgi:hypothetical protein